MKQWIFPLKIVIFNRFFFLMVDLSIAFFLLTFTRPGVLQLQKHWGQLVKFFGQKATKKVGVFEAPNSWEPP